MWAFILMFSLLTIFGVSTALLIIDGGLKTAEVTALEIILPVGLVVGTILMVAATTA